MFTIKCMKKITCENKYLVPLFDKVMQTPSMNIMSMHKDMTSFDKGHRHSHFI